MYFSSSHELEIDINDCLKSEVPYSHLILLLPIVGTFHVLSFTCILRHFAISEGEVQHYGFQNTDTKIQEPNACVVKNMSVALFHIPCMYELS